MNLFCLELLPVRNRSNSNRATVISNPSWYWPVLWPIQSYQQLGVPPPGYHIANGLCSVQLLLKLLSHIYHILLLWSVLHLCTKKNKQMNEQIIENETNIFPFVNSIDFNQFKTSDSIFKWAKRNNVTENISCEYTIDNTNIISRMTA